MKKEKRNGTLTNFKSNRRTSSIDPCELDSREIPLHGFNRFDPKYISIGPKASRESSLAANLNKCATLRHAGRYGGGLTDRKLIPVLKKASPPSIATVLREFNNSEPNNSKRNDISVMNNNIKTIYSGSNTSLIAMERGFNSDSASDAFPSLFKQSICKPSTNDFIEQDLADNCSFAFHRSYDDELQANAKSKKDYPIYRADIDSIKHAKSSQKVALNQRIPDVPPKLSNFRINQQLLSASELGNFRQSKTIFKNDTIDKNHNSNEISNRSQRKISQKKNLVSTSCKSSSDLSYEDERPPKLPPKSRNRNQIQNETINLKQTNHPNKQQINFNFNSQMTTKKPKNTTAEHKNCVYIRELMPSSNRIKYDHAQEILKKHIHEENTGSSGVHKSEDMFTHKKGIYSVSRQHSHENSSHKFRERVTGGYFDLKDLHKKNNHHNTSSNSGICMNSNKPGPKWKRDHDTLINRPKNMLPNNNNILTDQEDEISNPTGVYK